MLILTVPLFDTKLAGLSSSSADSVGRVSITMANGLKTGGTEPSGMKDYGFLQQRITVGFVGHTRGIFFIDKSKFPTGCGS